MALNSLFCADVPLSNYSLTESADIIYLICDAYRQFAGQAYLLTSKSRSRTEYLIPADNILVFA